MGQIYSTVKDFVTGNRGKKRKRESPLREIKLHQLHVSPSYELTEKFIPKNVDLSSTYLENIPAVTSRPPLRPITNLISNERDLFSEEEYVEPPAKKKRVVLNYLDFPQLDDPATIHHIYNSKVSFFYTLSFSQNNIFKHNFFQ